MSENSIREEKSKNQSTAVNSETQRLNTPTTTSASSSTSGGNVPMTPEMSRNVMNALLSAGDSAVKDSLARQRKTPKQTYAFWGSQPVTQFNDNEVELLMFLVSIW